MHSKITVLDSLVRIAQICFIALYIFMGLTNLNNQYTN